MTYANMEENIAGSGGEEKNIGVAVVGTGFGGKIHIPGFEEHHRTKVVAVYDRNLEKAKAIAANHSIPLASDRLTDIIASPEVVGVSISTPPFLHYEMAKAALEAGKHLLLEKPTTMAAEEARSLARLAEERGLAATMDFEFRFVPAWQRLKELLDEGYCGNLRFIKIDWLVPGRANPSRSWSWYAQKEKGGGILGAVGSHAFDYISWLFAPVQRLSGIMKTAISDRPDPDAGGELKPVDADDTCMVTMELADGTPCQLNMSSVTYQGRGHWVEVYGDLGTLVLGSNNLKDYVRGFRLLGAAAGESLQEIEIPKRLEFKRTYPDGRLAPFIRIVDRWVESIDAGRSLVPSLQEGTYSQLLMDLTHQSNNSRSWVEVPNFQAFLAR